MTALPLISVIVPVYNVASYLSDCIDSLLRQRYTNLEIILIDDGSTDESPEICDDYARRDERIRVIHKSNGGLSDARNSGIAAAHGELVGFVDSDDWIDDEMYAQLWQAMSANGADIAGCAVTAVLNNGTERPFNITEYAIYSNEEALGELITEKRIKQTVWNKLYRIDLLRGRPFPQGRLCEDNFWSYQVIGAANRVVQIARPCYYYRQRADSIMSDYSERHLDGLLAHWEFHDYLRHNYPALAPQADRKLLLASLFHYHCMAGNAALDSDGSMKRQISSMLRNHFWQFLFNPRLGKYVIWLVIFCISPALWYYMERRRSFIVRYQSEKTDA